MTLLECFTARWNGRCWQIVLNLCFQNACVYTWNWWSVVHETELSFLLARKGCGRLNRSCILTIGDMQSITHHKCTHWVIFVMVRGTCSLNLGFRIEARMSGSLSSKGESCLDTRAVNVDTSLLLIFISHPEVLLSSLVYLVWRHQQLRCSVSVINQLLLWMVFSRHYDLCTTLCIYNCYNIYSIFLQWLCFTGISAQWPKALQEYAMFYYILTTCTSLLKSVWLIKADNFRMGSFRSICICGFPS